MELDLKQVLGNLLLTVLILLLVARGISFVGEVQPTPLSVVESDSMEPTFSAGDLIFWRPTTIDEVEEGDIVVYSSQSREGDLIIHRVVEVREESGEKELITQGDANDNPDQNGLEPPVREKNLLGTPVSIGGWSLKIPLIGHIWILLSVSVTAAMAGGLASGGIAMLIPLLTAGIMIILTILFISPEEEDEDEKIKRLIFEEEKSHIWELFLIIFIVFAFIIVPSTWFGSETVSISIGVDESAEESADHSYSYAQQGEVIPGNQTVDNPGHALLTHHVTVRGEESEWVSMDQKNFRTSPGGNHTINFQIEVPDDAEPGTYNKEIVDHYSPFWIIYPKNFVGRVIEGNPSHGALILNLFTTLMFTLVTLGVMLSLSYIIDRYTQWKECREAEKAIKMRDKKVKLSIWERISAVKEKAKTRIIEFFDWMRGVNVIEFDPKKPLYASSIGLLAVPLYFLGIDLWVVFGLVSLSSGMAYYLGCRWRAEIFFSALISSGIVFMTLLFIPFSIPYLTDLTITNLAILLQSLAVIILLYIILVPFILFISYLTVYLLHWYNINRSAGPVKELSDI